MESMHEAGSRAGQPNSGGRNLDGEQEIHFRDPPVAPGGAEAARGDGAGAARHAWIARRAATLRPDPRRCHSLRGLGGAGAGQARSHRAHHVATGAGGRARSRARGCSPDAGRAAAAGRSRRIRHRHHRTPSRHRRPRGAAAARALAPAGRAGDGGALAGRRVGAQATGSPPARRADGALPPDGAGAGHAHRHRARRFPLQSGLRHLLAGSQLEALPAGAGDHLDRGPARRRRRDAQHLRRRAHPRRRAAALHPARARARLLAHRGPDQRRAVRQGGLRGAAARGRARRDLRLAAQRRRGRLRRGGRARPAPSRAPSKASAACSPPASTSISTA